MKTPPISQYTNEFSTMTSTKPEDDPISRAKVMIAREIRASRPMVLTISTILLFFVSEYP